MAEDPTPQKIAALLMDYVETGSGKTRRLRNRLKKLPMPLVIPILKDLLLGADNRRAFDRLARLLAEMSQDAPDDSSGSFNVADEAVAALAQHVRTNPRFPRLALRALAQCDHPQVVPVLIDRLIHGRLRQREAAAQHLAGKRSAMAIEPLCQSAIFPESGIQQVALDTLRAMGRPEHLARLLLVETALNVRDRVRILRALESLPLSLFRFRAQRFLDREAANPASPVAREAKACADLMRASDTLLRPTENPGTDTLLRPAFGPGPGDPEELLRASDEPEDDDDLEEPPMRRGGWWSTIARFFIRR
jgi:HEAT repeat protein